MRQTSPLHRLIATVPPDALRELVLDLLLNSPTSLPADTPAPTPPRRLRVATPAMMPAASTLSRLSSGASNSKAVLKAARPHRRQYPPRHGGRPHRGRAVLQASDVFNKPLPLRT